MPKTTKTNIKKAISWMIGIPSAVIVASEVNDTKLWWIQFLAMAALILILFWNGAIQKESIKKG